MFLKIFIKQMFKYCPKCSGKLEFRKEDLKNPVCQDCGFKFYQNSKPTASALIYDEKGRVLLSKRSIEPHYGCWDIVGGFLEEGEDPKDGLRREVKEEIGVDIKIEDIVGIYIDKYYNKKELDDSYTFNVYYASKIIFGEPKLLEEISELKWFLENEIPWDKLAFDNTKSALKDFFKK